MNSLNISRCSNYKIVLSTGLALFAMYFGAGNLVYPLQIGAHAGDDRIYAILGFLLTGVAIPWLGLYSMLLYRGNIEEIFQPLGKFLTHTIMIVIALIIGVFFANPRTATVSSATLAFFFPESYYTPIVLHLIFFSIVFAVAANKSRIVDILGYVFSPIKLVLLTTLIFFSLFTVKQIYPTSVSTMQIFSGSFFTGYNTMDLFASILFCSIAVAHLSYKLNLTEGNLTQFKKVGLYSCVVGAVVISIVYCGFILAANDHAALLQHSSTAGLITILAKAMLGNIAALFVASCVTFACLATSIAITVSVTNMFHDMLKRYINISYISLLSILVIINFIISNYGFDKIMMIASPILNVLYPFLIVFLATNLFAKIFDFQRRLSYILLLSVGLYFIL